MALTRGPYLFLGSNSFIFLFLENYGVRKLEAVFAVLIGTMGLSFAWMFADAKPNMRELLIGEKTWEFIFVCFTADTNVYVL